MKKTALLATAFCIGISGAAFAGDDCCAVGKEGKGAHKVEMLKEKLSLTDDQAKQIQSIFDAKKEKMEALKEETRAQVDAVLTPEQREKHEALKKEWEEKREERRQEKHEHEGHEGHEETTDKE